MSKRILFFILFSWLASAAFPAFAQQKTDTVYTFRFVPRKDMFYVPWNDNGKELARLLECIESNKPDIVEGRLPLYVDGYCNSGKSERASLAIAGTRSNRVKSELITRKGLRENNFITRNHASKGDFVTVRIILPKEKVPVIAEDTHPGYEEENEQSHRENDKATETIQDTEGAKVSTGQENQPESVLSASSTTLGLSLRANLLRWATLTPDLGIEWHINPSWGISVNGSWTSWSWNEKDRRYALWEVAPEFRRYIGKEKRGYLGVMFKTGQFNYKLSATGKQGDLTGGGITGGYQLKLNNALSMDFSLGLGYIHADYDKYVVINGVRVRRGSETKNWWGPVSAGVTLVWNIF